MKIGIEGGTNWVAEYYEATVVSALDYYPFGSAMAGRKYNDNSYRYGFNGMEKDDEMKGNGNTYDFGARLYDSRVGRWLAVDPLASKYSNLSPYNFVANTPIRAIDPDGKAIIIVNHHYTRYNDDGSTYIETITTEYDILIADEINGVHRSATVIDAYHDQYITEASNNTHLYSYICTGYEIKEKEKTNGEMMKANSRIMYYTSKYFMLGPLNITQSHNFAKGLGMIERDPFDGHHYSDMEKSASLAAGVINIALLAIPATGVYRVCTGKLTYQLTVGTAITLTAEQQIAVTASAFIITKASAIWGEKEVKEYMNGNYGLMADLAKVALNLEPGIKNKALTIVPQTVESMGPVPNERQSVIVFSETVWNRIIDGMPSNLKTPQEGFEWLIENAPSILSNSAVDLDQAIERVMSSENLQNTTTSE